MMKAKLKIFKIFVVFIAILILMGAVSASDDLIGNDTIKISDEEPIITDESNSNLESDISESSQDNILSQTNDDNLGNDSDTTTSDEKTEATITSGNLKAEYLSGKSVKTVITDKATGKGIETLLNVQYIKNGKIVKDELYYTDSNGVAYITPELAVGTYTMKISPEDDNITAKTISKTVTIVKTSSKVTAKKVSAYKGYKITLKAVLSKTKCNDKINEGKVKFKINGKTYLVKVKKGVATKKIKLSKAKTYKYTVQFMGTKNIKKSKISRGKAIIKKVYDTKLTVKNMRGSSGEKKNYQIKVTTTSGKKVSSGQVKITWGGKSILCNVTNGVVKLVGTFGGNFKETKDGNKYYYKEYTTNFKAKYIPTSLKYKTSTAKYKMIATYKCSTCGKTVTHTHITNETTTKIFVV